MRNVTMNNVMKTASTLALAAVLAGGPLAAVAQSTDGTATTAPEAAAGATTDTTAQNAPVTPGADTTMNADSTTEPAIEAAPATEMAEAEPATKPVEGQIVMQDEDTILSSDLVGANVYSSGGEAIGEINDLIVRLDGAVEGVVIGVGGFLGLGEKDVAVEMASLSTSTDESGALRLITSATRADLEAAEEFLTKDEVAAARQSLDTMPADTPADGQPAPSN
jgi:sporulation protein YlmC with PRC-barrel domain